MGGPPFLERANWIIALYEGNEITERNATTGIRGRKAPPYPGCCGNFLFSAGSAAI
jgi:hypothetical protein